MGTHIVILGCGTAGTMTANRLCRTYGEREYRITVVDQDDDHLYQPGLLFVPFGLAQPPHLLRSRPRQLNPAVHYQQARIERVDLDARTVHLGGGIRLRYDVLVVASGAALLPEETEGLTGPGWGEKVFTFYDLPGAVGLHRALECFDGGRLVIDVADLPVKCPVASANVTSGRTLPRLCSFGRSSLPPLHSVCCSWRTPISRTRLAGTRPAPWQRCRVPAW